MEDDHIYFDINNNQQLYCPHCGVKQAKDNFDSHLTSCSNNNRLNKNCEICNILIKTNTEDNVYYIDHLISTHTFEEIGDKVKDSKILNFLGIECTHQKELIHKNYKMYQCNLCKNLIDGLKSGEINNVDENQLNQIKINHLKNFHKISIQNNSEKNFTQLLNDLTGIKVIFKSSSDFHKCAECEIFMEYSPDVINYHNIIHKLNLNFLKENENKIYYCSECEKLFNIEERHDHYSFIEISGKTNELHLQYIQIKENFENFPMDIENNINSTAKQNNNIFNNITNNFSNNIFPLPVPISNKGKIKPNIFDEKINTTSTAKTNYFSPNKFLDNTNNKTALNLNSNAQSSSGFSNFFNSVNSKINDKIDSINDVISKPNKIHDKFSHFFYQDKKNQEENEIFNNSYFSNQDDDEDYNNFSEYSDDNLSIPNYKKLPPKSILKTKNLNNRITNKKQVADSVDLKIKEWELFSSVCRIINNTKIDSEFREKFSDKVFDYFDFMSHNSNLHYYRKEKKESTAFLLKRLNTEFTKLNENLPCNFSSSYFIRADSNYPQFIKVLIAGSRGTPYEHGLYEFDIYLPGNYPLSVPKCQLKTTGNGSVRFNPNLYNCGKVCLSLLGTWSGSSVEKWDPKHSSLTQLLISLSSLVMNDRIIENEPSYGNSLSTIRGLEENEGYANIVRIGNISYAMIDQIKNGNKIFGDVVKEYFDFKSKEMMLDIETWLNRYKNSTCKYTGLASIQNNRLSEMLNNNGYEPTLNKKIEELKNLLKI
jgi:ubiquitin-protein ligase